MKDNTVLNVTFGIPIELVKNAIQTIDAREGEVITDEQKKISNKSIFGW